MCGSQLSSSKDIGIIAREALVKPIESEYYSAALVHFPPICYYYEEPLNIKIKNSSNIMLWYILCLSDGKKPDCKNVLCNC